MNDGYDDAVAEVERLRGALTEAQGRVRVLLENAASIDRMLEVVAPFQNALTNRLTARIAALEGALRPFTHPDLRSTTSSNLGRDDSPIYGRDKAVLTLGDFRRAAAVLAGETL